jgi:hypothetical protein
MDEDGLVEFCPVPLPPPGLFVAFPWAAAFPAAKSNATVAAIIPREPTLQPSEYRMLLIIGLVLLC